MNDQEVQMQITQMVQFIHQEAKEKANEIRLKTDEEFNIEKLRHVEGEKQKIRAAYEAKEKQVEVQKRIEQSKEVRNSRLKGLESRDKAMEAVLAEAMAKLPMAIVQNAGKYGPLLEGLILEALILLADTKVEVKPVAGQTQLVRNAVPKATAKFKEWAIKNKGAEWANEIEVTVSTSCIEKGVGGIEVCGFGGKITLANTLAQRLMLAYETQLPQLRAALFG